MAFSINSYAQDGPTEGSKLKTQLEKKIAGKTISNKRIILNSKHRNHNAKEPLYVINNIPISKEELEELNPKHIAEINVFKGDKATVLYGASGANGVIVIKLKKKYAKKFKKRMEAKQ